jgi:hypothetical protein
MGGNGMLATADAGSTVVICTPTGFKRIALGDRPARDGSSQSAPIKAPLCPMCQAVQASATTVPTTAFAACDLRPAIAAAQFPPFDSRLVDRAYRSGLQARAPPPTV